MAEQLNPEAVARERLEKGVWDSTRDVQMVKAGIRAFGEAACKAECWACDNDGLSEKNERGGWVHPKYDGYTHHCTARKIRALLEQLDAEGE